MDCMLMSITMLNGIMSVGVGHLVLCETVNLSHFNARHIIIGFQVMLDNYH